MEYDIVRFSAEFREAFLSGEMNICKIAAAEYFIGNEDFVWQEREK